MSNAQLGVSRPISLPPILTAALEAFDEHGYHGATVRDIANRVGVTVPALYYHHENKEAILFALLDASITRIGAQCRDIEQQVVDPVARFDQLVAAIVEHMAISPKLAHLDAEIRSLSDSNRRSYSAKRSTIERRLRHAVEAGVDEGVFQLENPRETVRALLGMIQAITTWYRTSGELSIEALIDQYRSFARRLVGATTS